MVRDFCAKSHRGQCEGGKPTRAPAVADDAAASTVPLADENFGDASVEGPRQRVPSSFSARGLFALLEAVREVVHGRTPARVEEVRVNN